MILLAFDYGTQKIGLASGNDLIGTASPLTPLPSHNGQPDWDRVAALLDEWRPDTLVVGLPLNMDGSESPSSARARKFARRLHGRCPMRTEETPDRSGAQKDNSAGCHVQSSVLQTEARSDSGRMSE